ncbi:MAG: hypothetical protein ABID64_01030 [Nitrospirota bacterium]
MKGLDTQDDYSLEFDKRIFGLYPDDLQVDNYLNVETQSGSGYVFRVTSKDDEGGVIIELISGPKALKKGARGKIANTKIELGNILDFEGGTTSTLVGIVVTQGEPFEYPYVKSEYNEFLEELDSDQLCVGDHIYFGTEDGQTYVVEVIDVDEKMPLIKFVDGRNPLVGGEGYLKIKNLRIGMKFRNTLRSTMPIQNMFVLPHMDGSMLDVLDEEFEIQELEYDAEIESFYISQLQDGDFVHIGTAGANNSTYVIEFNNNAIEIVGGKNSFVGGVGRFASGKINKGHRLRTTIARTSNIKSIKLTKTYEPEGYGEVDSLRKDLEARQIAAITHPAGSMTNPVIWLGMPSGIHKLEIFDELGLDSRDLTISALRKAWEEFQINNDPDNLRGLLPSVYSDRLKRFRTLERQYESLVLKLERMNEILEEE